MGDKILRLSDKIESLENAIIEFHTRKWVDEKEACEILFVRSRTLARMRAEKEIPFIRVHRKILYKVTDLHEYLERNIKTL